MLSLSISKLRAASMRPRLVAAALLSGLLSLSYCWDASAQPVEPAAPAASEDSPAPPAPPSAVEECLPACRSGFMCVRGSCVSACNPPCDAGQTCSATGECIEKEAPAPVAAPPAATGFPAEAETVEMDSEPEEPIVSSTEPRSGMVFVPRIGILLSGSGEETYDSECTGDPCGAFPASGSTDFSDKSQFLIEADFLFHVGPSMRIGFGAMLVPDASVEGDNATSSYDMGVELTPVGIIEGVFGGKVAGTVRGFAGMAVLFPSGDMADGITNAENECDAIRAGSSGASCSVGSGPFLGYTLGVSGGILGQVSRSAALRADLAIQYQSTAGASFDMSDDTAGSIELDSTYSTTRFWLIAGIEL